VQQIDGVLLVRPDAPLCYPNAQAVHDAIDAAATVTKPAPAVVVLDLDANDSLDITSAEHLSKLQHELAGTGMQQCLAHIHDPVMEMATETGLVERLGAQHVFPNIDAAVLWARSHGE
jgi:SulP family sulfate permease